MATAEQVEQIAAAALALRTVAAIGRVEGLLDIPTPIIGDKPLQMLARQVLILIGVDVLMTDASGAISDADKARVAEVCDALERTDRPLHRPVDFTAIVLSAVAVALPAWAPLARAFGAEPRQDIASPSLALHTVFSHFSGGMLSLESQMQTASWVIGVDADDE